MDNLEKKSIMTRLDSTKMKEAKKDEHS